MKKFGAVLIPILLLIGCTSAPEEKTTLEVVKVETELPADVQIEEEVDIRTHVTQWDENVEDAKEVQIEIWNVEEGKENSELIDAEHNGDGIYEVKYSFEKKGIYRIQSHVTARDMHVMPTKQLVVGDLTQEQIDEILGSVESAEEESDHEGSGHHH
ncbi:FixH family protein [Bacillus haimaensis]|uniref:FixH family protein n=1 Tax=Bacillus haimaensis TaxID=3160967 RepID=UPI003AA8B118